MSTATTTAPRSARRWRLNERMASALLLVGLVALLLMAAISAWLTWTQTQQALSSRLSTDLRLTAVELLSAVQEAHIAQTAYAARGDAESLRTLDQAWQTIDARLQSLQDLASQNASHTVALSTVVALLGGRRDAYHGMKNGALRLAADEYSLAEIGRQLKQISAVEGAGVMQTRRDAETNRAWLMAGTLGTALVASLLCFGAYLMIRRRLHVLEASERVLSAFNAELESSVRQRTVELEEAKSEVEREKGRAEALLSDLNHRVGNSLQIVSSLVNMHANRVSNGEAREILASVRSNVHAIASAQRRMRLTGANDRVELAALLESLIDDMRKAMAGGAEIDIALDAQDATVASHDAISISVIVMEAINNAIKYASSEATPVSIKVTIDADREQRPLRVTIEDDGVGFDDSSQAGLGTEVTSALAASLRARLGREHVDPHAARKGTRVTLDFAAEAA
jgi:two-component sensor histidine kinase